METKLIIIVCLFYGIAAKGVNLKNQTGHKSKDEVKAGSSQNFACASEDQQTAHETKCNLYYRCVYGKNILKTCPDGMLFNSKLSNCDSSYNVDCGALENEKNDNKDNKYNFFDYYAVEDTTNTDTLNYSEETTSNPETECPVKEDPYEPNPVLPHEEKCNAFYKCVDGKKHIMKCPGILQFNPKVLACDWPRNVKCVDKNPLTTSSTEALSTESSTTVTSELKISNTSSQENPNMTNLEQSSEGKLNLSDSTPKTSRFKKSIETDSEISGKLFQISNTNSQGNLSNMTNLEQLSEVKLNVSDYTPKTSNFEIESDSEKTDVTNQFTSHDSSNELRDLELRIQRLMAELKQSENDIDSNQEQASGNRTKRCCRSKSKKPKK